MLRASSFNICVEVPGSDTSILVNGLSGSIDVIDLDIARSMNHQTFISSESRLHQLPDQAIEYLESRGYLTHLGYEAERRHAKAVAARLQTQQADKPPIFYLMATYDCQLRCTYCFEHGTRRRGHAEGWSVKSISEPIISAAFSAMERLSANSSTKSCTLYGGEPLLQANRPVIDLIVCEARKRGYLLMAATNGFDLDQFFHVLGADAIAGLHVPVDGDHITHDKLRFAKHREPTFERIINNLANALVRGVSIKMRVNANRDVLDRLEQLADLLEERGFLQSPLFSSYIKAIFETRNGQAHARSSITDADVAERLAGSTRLARIFSGYPVIHHRIDSLFTHQLDEALQPNHCGAPTGHVLIFDPFGQIFPCNNVVGEKEHRIGTYYPVLRWHTETRDRWKRRTVTNMPDVQMCKYALFCGGGCLYDAQIASGSIDVKSCDCEAFSRQFENLVLASYERILRTPALAAS